MLLLFRGFFKGLGFSALLVASFGCAAAEAGESPSSLALINGMFSSSLALGNFLGPTLSAILLDAFGGGAEGFTYNSVVLQALVIVTLGLNILACRSSRNR